MNTLFIALFVLNITSITLSIMNLRRMKIIHAERNEMIDTVLGIIDKYREGVSD